MAGGGGSGTGGANLAVPYLRPVLQISKPSHNHYGIVVAFLKLFYVCFFSARICGGPTSSWRSADFFLAPPRMA